jgi:CubicO group peptidase (beta-lactamase class C family)
VLTRIAPVPGRRGTGSLTLVAAAVILTALLPAGAGAQAGPLDGLDDYVTRALAEWEVPGLAIAVIRNDSIVHARGYGVRELGRADRVDENTLFAVASTTKAMTAAALGMLVDEDRLDWDDRVSVHLPWYRLSDPFITHELTVRDLLTHRTGIARSDNLWIAGPFERAEVLRRARYLPPARGFRSEYGYHNVMYIAAGEVVGEVSGMSWDEFIERRLFEPLGMARSTTRASVVETRDNVAASHTNVNGSVQAVPRRNYDNIGGAGAVFSSARDMAQWIRLHLGNGTYEGRRLLSPETMRELHMPQVVLRMDTTAERMFPQTNLKAYALGWNVQDYHGRKLVHHAGSLNWTRTQVGMVPSERIGVVVIANYGSSDLQTALMYRVLDALMGLPARDWSEEYLALARRARERSAAAPQNEQIPGTQPSLGLADYAGTYTSDLYGDMRLTVEDGRLVLDYAPDYVADLKHWHHDTYRASWRREGFGRAFVTFGLDRRGRAIRMDLDGFGEFTRVHRDSAER